MPDNRPAPRPPRRAGPDGDDPLAGETNDGEKADGTGVDTFGIYTAIKVGAFECNGLGSKYDFDPAKIIVDWSKPLLDGAHQLGDAAAVTVVPQSPSLAFP